MEQSEIDKRYKQVKLTYKSREIHNVMQKNLFEAENVLYKNLSEDDKKELYRILKIMMNNLAT